MTEENTMAVAGPLLVQGTPGEPIQFAQVNNPRSFSVPIHPLVEWAARSIVWGRLGVPVPASHATAMERAMNARWFAERVKQKIEFEHVYDYAVDRWLS